MADEWFYVQNKKKLGPVPFAQLQQLAASGQLQAADMVLQGGTTKWAAAETVAGLFPAAADYLPPAPSEQEQEEVRAGFADVVDTAPQRIKPHQGSLLLLMGGLGLAFGLISLFGQCCTFFVLPGVYALLIPAPVLALGLGVSAWRTGGLQPHLLSIQHMDQAGEGQTQLGWIFGIIATVLGIIGILMYLTIVVFVGATSRFQE